MTMQTFSRSERFDSWVFLILCVFIFLHFGGVANSNDVENVNVRDVIQQYCELDGLGHRLSSATYPDVRKLMAWDDDRDEPGWDCALIISGYEVGTIEILDDNARATIEYSIVARDCSGSNLERKNYVEKVDVSLVRVSKAWKIEDYISVPRVYISTMIDYSRDHLAYIKGKTPVNKEEIAYIEGIIVELILLEDDN